MINDTNLGPDGFTSEFFKFLGGKTSASLFKELQTILMNNYTLQIQIN